MSGALFQVILLLLLIVPRTITLSTKQRNNPIQLLVNAVGLNKHRITFEYEEPQTITEMLETVNVDDLQSFIQLSPQDISELLQLTEKQVSKLLRFAHSAYSLKDIGNEKDKKYDSWEQKRERGKEESIRRDDLKDEKRQNIKKTMKETKEKEEKEEKEEKTEQKEKRLRNSKKKPNNPKKSKKEESTIKTNQKNSRSSWTNRHSILYDKLVEFYKDRKLFNKISKTDQLKSVVRQYIDDEKGLFQKLLNKHGHKTKIKTNDANTEKKNREDKSGKGENKTNGNGTFNYHFTEWLESLSPTSKYIFIHSIVFLMTFNFQMMLLSPAFILVACQGAAKPPSFLYWIAYHGPSKILKYILYEFFRLNEIGTKLYHLSKKSSPESKKYNRYLAFAFFVSTTGNHLLGYH
jgi:hypothetical protein